MEVKSEELKIENQRSRVVIPSYNAQESLASVIQSVLANGWKDVLVIDDGSTDNTADVARKSGARVVAHDRNRGKGAALRTALQVCQSDGVRWMYTLDADGQHRAEDLTILRTAVEEMNGKPALILGIRNLAKAGAPRANQISNGISNFFLSLFARKRLRDTQCGLRVYPVAQTIALGARGTGYELESELILRSARANIPIIEREINVHYPEEKDRKTHFRTSRDVPRIIFRTLEVLSTFPVHD